MKYINVSDLAGPDWRFLEAETQDPRLRWEIYSGQRRGWLEQAVRRPNLGRYRACYQAVRALRASKDGVLVSHLPSTTVPANLLRDRMAADRPHIGFAFNFTDLPRGRRRKIATKGLQTVDEFVVFSRFEQQLYSDYFNLPIERFHFLPWAMDTPTYERQIARPFAGPYLCALGGEGRDYGILLEAMRALPEVKLALIARPYNLVGLEVPDNVKIYTNIPSGLAWGIAKQAEGMVIPLKTGETANGHVTIVATQHLGLPLAVTRSQGVTDYVSGDTGFLMEAGDADSVADALRAMLNDGDAARRKAEHAQQKAAKQNVTRGWVEYFETLENRFSG